MMKSNQVDIIKTAFNEGWLFFRKKISMSFFLIFITLNSYADNDLIKNHHLASPDANQWIARNLTVQQINYEGALAIYTFSTNEETNQDTCEVLEDHADTQFFATKSWYINTIMETAYDTKYRVSITFERFKNGKLGVTSVTIEK